LSTALKRKEDAVLDERMETRVAGMDWARVGTDLDGGGWALLKGLLNAKECEALAGLYDKEQNFRSTVVMARHGFGRGEYKYFAYPLPDIVAALRPALYARLMPIANRWNEAMTIAVRYPKTHAEFIRRCHAAGQTQPTPLLLKYGAGDYNCLHQDLYGEHVFSAADGDPAVGAGRRFHRRRVRADRATAAHAVTTGGGAAAAWRCRGVRGPPSPGAGHARHLSRHHAARRQRAAFRPSPDRRHHLPRRQVADEQFRQAAVDLSACTEK
jgi:uncharacterized protein